MEPARNQILLQGTLQDAPAFSHENHGKNFYRFYLEVPRLSEAVDTLPIVAEARLLEDLELSPGTSIAVTGQIRSHNLHADGRRHLMIFVFAASLTAEDGPSRNDVLLDAVLCPGPRFPPHTPRPGNLRCDAGGSPCLSPGGLSPRHSLG